MNGRDFCEVILFLSEVSYVEVRGDKSTLHIRVTYTEGTRLYCDYFIWCVSCAMVVLTGFVMCVCVCVCVCVCFCGCV